MILRKWHGTAYDKDVDIFAAYMGASVVKAYENVQGYRGHQIIKRPVGDRLSEIMLLSWWDSMDAIHAFAGPNPQIARYWPEDHKYLVEKPEFVEHFDVVIDHFPK